MLEIHRDLVFLEEWKLIGESFVVTARSGAADQSLAPSPEKCVRAELISPP